MKLKIILVSFLMLITSSAIIAQSTSSSSSRYGLPNRNDFDKWSIGVHVGPNYFQGDIQKNSENNNSLKELPFDLMYGAHVAYQFTHTSAIRAGATFGKFSGESEEAIRSGMKEYLYTYESPVKEYFIDFVFTSGNISYLKRNKKFHLLGSIGIGIFNFDGELKNIDPKIGASPSNPFLAVQTGNVTEGMMTLGLGFKYRLGKRFDAGLTYDFRKTFTDKVDGINKPTTESDNYSMLNLNINYTFGKKNQQMEWVNPVEIVYNDMAELKDKMDLLSGDKDKDGVSDIFDKDNSTPEGVKVYGDGTAVDTDGDGIPDHLDSDPFSTKGATVDATGAEIDTDGDGVPDSRDLEPNTPKGSLVNFQGIAIGDNLASAGGAGSYASGWLPSIFFDTDKSNIKSNQQDRILIVARMLKKNDKLKLNIIGHTDIDAGESYNQKLGQRRADAVKDNLIKVYGIDGSRLTTESRGKTEQFAKGNKAMNRRVDFEVAK
ncbi:MAG: OmpA family protein [Bacteroidia bacterium]|nr:OmpA family protein [Bacteroidia bacterium]